MCVFAEYKKMVISFNIKSYIYIKRRVAWTSKSMPSTYIYHHTSLKPHAKLVGTICFLLKLSVGVAVTTYLVWQKIGSRYIMW